MTASKHVSTFELDVYFASRDEASAEATRISAHIASCERCAAYLE